MTKVHTEGDGWCLFGFSNGKWYVPRYCWDWRDALRLPSDPGAMHPPKRIIRPHMKGQKPILLPIGL
ncbi:hypothetical protein S101447_01612 [Acetobacter ascendens]|uniref:Uncharacterized protein n=1 Tax=Acetobacter ascendens TaxID=481146 RepID=A0A1Y0UYQ0_9PROT|nr:hypothetical protein S101447_01612 [Acetobacter ascendens]